MASIEAVGSSEPRPPSINEAAVNRIQAAFEVQHGGPLIYSGQLKQENLYHLTRIVAKHPETLQNHVRRVYLCLECKHRAALIGALVDLFLILRGRGDTLFFRLLEQSAKVLGERITKTLDAAFRANDASQALRLPLDYSVLSNGKDGSIFRI